MDQAAYSRRADDLIARHILDSPNDRGASDARLADSGLSVWALVGYIKIVGGDLDLTAHDYDISREALEAALAFYFRHQAVIDAHITLNAE